MSMRRTPPLSLRGSQEVIDEMNRPPADTPERRRTFEIARRWRPVEGQPGTWVYHPGPDEGDPGEVTVSMRHTPPLSVEGSREVIEEMNRPPEDTPERRATFQRASEMHRFVEAIISSSKPHRLRLAARPS